MPRGVRAATRHRRCSPSLTADLLCCQRRFVPTLVIVLLPKRMPMAALLPLQPAANMHSRAKGRGQEG